MKYSKQINSIFDTIDDGYLIDLICDFSSIKSVWDPENGFNELKAAQWFENQAEISVSRPWQPVDKLMRLTHNRLDGRISAPPGHPRVRVVYPWT